MNAELMKKAAVTIRQLGSENQSLKGQIEALEGTASSFGEAEKVANTSKAVLGLIVNGEVDPEDALEKFAELSDLSAEEIKLVLGKCEVEEIGHIKAASADLESDPLSAYLFGM